MPSARPMRHHSASLTTWTDFASSRGHGDGVSFRIEHRGIAVGVGEGFGDRPLGQPGDLVEHRANGIDIEIAIVSGVQYMTQAQHLKEIELDIANIGDVVPQRISLQLDNPKSQCR